MPAARSEMPAAVLDGRIYVPGGFGGERAFEVYDLETGDWRALAPLPEGRHHAMAAAQAGRVYVFGGARSVQDWTPTDEAWTYDPAADRWTELARMPEARLAGAAVPLGESVYIAGGTGGSADLLRYDPANNTWARLAPMNQPREHTAAVALEGKIYAIAGRWEGQAELSSVEVYDPGTDAWTAGPPLAEARAGFAAAVLDGRILVAGGEVLSDPPARALDSVEVFDPALGQWLPGLSLPLPLHGVPAAAAGGHVFLLGGSSRAGAVDNAGRVFSLPSAALGQASANLGSGSIRTSETPTTISGPQPTPPADPGTAAATPASPAESTPAVALQSPTPIPSPGDPWVESVLAQMTLEQRVGQLLLIGVDGRELSEEMCALVGAIRPGGVVYQRGNAFDPDQTRQLSKGLQDCAAAAVGVPLWISIDHEGEYINRFNQGATTFPAALAQGATGDPAAARRAAQAMGGELAYSGVNMVLGPVADVLLTYENEVISQRTFGGDPERAAAFVAEAVAGFRQAGLVPVLKHFPGHGGVAGDSHETLPVDEVDRAGLEARYLPPFRSGLAAGAPAVMLAHVAFPKVTGTTDPATLSPAMVRLLREELGFRGLILSDAMNMRGVTGGTIPVEDASLAAVQAGVDQLLITSAWAIRPTFERLLAAAQSGEIPLEALDGSVRRILGLKASVGLTGFPRPEAPEPDWSANARLAYEIGYRAVTLFKDEAGSLPLPAEAQRLLVIAPQSDWTFYPALKAALEESGRSVEFAYFPPPWDGPVDDPQALETLPAKAQESDMVLLFTWQVHLSRLLSGDIWQADLAQRLLGTGRPLVVIAIKSPTDLLGLPPVLTYLAMYGSTAGQGQAVVDALTGAAEPTGQNPLPGLGN